MTKIYETNGMPYIEMTADEIKTHNEIIARVPIGNLQPKIELTELGKELVRDLEYLDKVAIDAMKVYLSKQHIAHVEAMGSNEWIARNSYEIAQAMLAEKKRVEAELLGVGNDV